MRAALQRRGPDGSGTWEHENVVFAHQRLAVIGSSEDGEQPMASADGRFHLVYNGELYNDRELRAELSATGVLFRGSCDTETVLRAFEAWGAQAFERFRGMFAIAVYDSVEHVLHVARDPLGIKPLYYHHASGEFVFASEPRALLAHPHIEARPNVPMLSAYLTSMRSVLGENTLFAGVFAVRPGESLRFDATSGILTHTDYYTPAPVAADEQTARDAEAAMRAALEDSVERHLRADVPVCSLLSGGIDSSILCRIVADLGVELNTWCAGGYDGDEEGEDFAFARAMADEVGAAHREIVVDSQRFLRDWEWMVAELGMPLCTPNEVAIHAVSRDLRDAGYVVALSGEGADELFAGYEHAMVAALDFLRSPDDVRSSGAFQLEAAAWIPTSLKQHVFAPDVFAACENDDFLYRYYDELFARCKREAGPHATALDPHLRFLRHNNLTGLLQRLDSSSMLASVEGRTPFSDVRIAEFADRLPMAFKFDTSPGATEVAGARGKTILRRAWSGRLANGIQTRPKQSFPLPFSGWLGERVGVLQSSSFANAFFGADVRREVMEAPTQYSQVAWPMINLALWGEHWFA